MARGWMVFNVASKRLERNKGAACHQATQAEVLAEIARHDAMWRAGDAELQCVPYTARHVVNSTM
jgi:hypothetical protein